MRLLEKKREEGMLLEKNIPTGDGFFWRRKFRNIFQVPNFLKELHPYTFNSTPKKYWCGRGGRGGIACKGGNNYIQKAVVA